ncbi:MAG: dTDP-4-dehydrorhamnose 3,5-epimerase, partial [Brevibacillus sp.]|nr:dTDP-4-dehydrorhamnose 3,5-epimerase [Brevibacillus sp.]
RGIRWDDPAIGIMWPTTSPILSAKDEGHPLLKDAEINF